MNLLVCLFAFVRVDVNDGDGSDCDAFIVDLIEILVMMVKYC